MDNEMTTVLAAILIATLTASAWAQDTFIAEYDAAKKLAPEESEAALSRLVDTAPKRVRDEVLALAADKAAIQKRFDAAEQYLAQMTDVNAQSAARINVLASKRDWKALIAFAKDLKFEDFPDNLVPRAAFQRGQAYGLTKDKVNAYKDLDLAIASTGNLSIRAEIIYQAAAVAGTPLGDPAKQVEFLAKLFPSDIGSLPIGSRQQIISMYADALTAQGKADASIAFLNENAKLVDKGASRIYLIKMSYATAYAAKGDKAKAAEFCTEASKLEELPAGWAEQARAKAEALRTSP